VVLEQSADVYGSKSRKRLKRKRWLMTHQLDNPNSTDAPANTAAEQQDAAAASVSDYSSVYLPRDLSPDELKGYLGSRCRGAEWSGKPLKLVGVVTDGEQPSN
jgi:hypothetical protein